MLAASMKPEKGQSIETLNYPVIASCKFDGIRCVIVNGKAKSRTLKDIPNDYIRKQLSRIEYEGFDGEILTYTDGVMDDFNIVSGKVMRQTGTPDFVYHVFDLCNVDDDYVDRIGQYQARADGLTTLSEVSPVDTVLCLTPSDLEAFTEKCLTDGFEGAIVRHPQGCYKQGRSTWREGGMTKIKPFEDAEAVITGFEEQMANNNAKVVNELGRNKRTSHKAGKTGKDTLGKFICRSKEFGEIKVGTGKGLTQALRQEIWDNQAKFKGKTITYKFQRIGMKAGGKPRIAVFKGFRHKHDI